MGPLADPVDFIEQLNNSNLKRLDLDNIACGVKIFCFGLFKKLMIADVFAKAVSWAYGNTILASSMDWILVMLFYTFQIYFDFSGYSDMAVGSSLMLNITLPINFDSPYQAMSLRDFWKRWHISLSKFLTKYIYIPLGGSKKGKLFTYINTLIVFTISGIWHGANWTYILWGFFHGLLMVLTRIFDKYENKIFGPVRWMATFGIVSFLRLLFRSDSIRQWYDITMNILSFENTTISKPLIDSFVLPEMFFLQNTFHLSEFTSNIRGFWMLIYLISAFGISLLLDNNYRNLRRNSLAQMLIAVIAFVWSFLSLSGESVFVYFNF